MLNFLMTRTPEGHLWGSWSEDDGNTWSDPQPTSLIHPDAPPMLFHLSDGKTLIAFHHNRCSYMDMFVDDAVLNLFVPHRWQQVLHLKIDEIDLQRFADSGRITVIHVTYPSPLPNVRN